MIENYSIEEGKAILITLDKDMLQFVKGAIDSLPVWVLITIVGLMWGCTNPILNKTSRPTSIQEKEKQQASFVHFVKSMLGNWTFMLFYGLNQLGSIFFYAILAKLDFSIAHPLSNAAAFVITAVMGVFLKEQKLTFTSVLGAILVLLGIYICISSRDVAKVAAGVVDAVAQNVTNATITPTAAENLL